MSGLPAWLLERRAARIVLIAAIFLVPLLGVASVAILALVTQIKGWRTALIDLGLGFLVLALMTAVAGGQWLGVGMGATVAWLLGVALAALRRLGGIVLAMQVAVLFAAIAVVLAYALIADLTARWDAVIGEFAAQASAAGMDLGPVEGLQAAAGMMTGMIVASALISSAIALLLGSAWASRMGAGDAAGEFRLLRMGHVIGGLALATLVAVLAGLRDVADDLAMVFGAGFLLQGVAVAYWQASQRRWPQWWALVMYAPMVIPVAAAVEVMALAIIGVVDNVFSLRRVRANMI
jgi:hypothetical protein